MFPARKTFTGGFKWVDQPRGKTFWSDAIVPIRDACPSYAKVARQGPGRGWHMFRHTFASHAVQNGDIDIYLVAEWLGHTSIAMTKRYAHVAARYNPAIERVMGRRGRGRKNH